MATDAPKPTNDPRPATAAEERGVADTLRAEPPKDQAEAPKDKPGKVTSEDEARDAELERQKVIEDAVANADEPDYGVGVTVTKAPRAAATESRSISWINPGNPGHDPETGEAL